MFLPLFIKRSYREEENLTQKKKLLRSAHTRRATETAISIEYRKLFSNKNSKMLIRHAVKCNPFTAGHLYTREMRVIKLSLIQSLYIAQSSLISRAPVYNCKRDMRDRKIKTFIFFIVVSCTTVIISVLYTQGNNKIYNNIDHNRFDFMVILLALRSVTIASRMCCVSMHFLCILYLILLDIFLEI